MCEGRAGAAGVLAEPAARCSSCVGRPEQTGAATGMNTVMRSLGGSVGSQVGASIIAGTVVGNSLPTEHGFAVAFLLTHEAA